MKNKYFALLCVIHVGHENHIHTLQILSFKHISIYDMQNRKWNMPYEPDFKTVFRKAVKEGSPNCEVNGWKLFGKKIPGLFLMIVASPEKAQVCQQTLMLALLPASFQIVEAFEELKMVSADIWLRILAVQEKHATAVDSKCIITIFKIILFNLIFDPSISEGTGFYFNFWFVKPIKHPRREPQPNFEEWN